MSTITPCTSTSRPTASTGRIAFETDTNNIIVYDGTAWRGYANDGASIGGSSYSLSLDGTDDRVTLGDVSALNSVSALSLSFWIKLNSATASNYVLSGAGASGSFYTGVTLTLQQVSTSYYPQINLGNGASGYDGARNSSINVNDGNWHHVAAVMSGSTYTVYLDGSSSGSAAVGNTVVTTTTSVTGDDFKIGARYDNNNTYAVNGYIDDVAIFDSALTASEVSNIKNNAMYPLSKLKHLYKFENNFNDSIGSLNGTAQSDAQTTTTTTRP